MTTIPADTLVNQRFKILRELGKGGMATVYLAEDQRLEAEVALKFLNSDQLRVERRRDRFLREFQILSKLNHPAIVKVYEQLETEEAAPFFSMEFIRGKTLADMIKDHYASDLAAREEFTKAALNQLKEIAIALQYLHGRGVIYCDLKPTNILVPEMDSEAKTSSVRIKLLDFGIAVLAEQQTSEEAANMIGTSYYMSPEQIRSEKLNYSSDIYSFGVLAFELLTGTVPFASDTLFTVTASHLIGKVPLAQSINRYVPASIDRMIHICMEKEASNRYGSMEEIIGRLEAVTEEGSKPSSFFGKMFNRIVSGNKK